jgi:hypothetical protein
MEDELHGTCRMHGRITHKIVDRKPDAKRPTEKPMLKWEDNINTNFKEIRFESVGWIHVRRLDQQPILKQL